MQQILRRLTLHTYLKHKWLEQVTTGLLNIDLNASNDTNLDVWNRLDNALYILMRDAIQCVCQLCHRLLCLLNLIVIWLECLTNVHKLVVKSVCALWHFNLG